MIEPRTKQENINENQQVHIDEHRQLLAAIIKKMQEMQTSIDLLRVEAKEDKSFAAFTISIVLVLVMAGVLSMSLIAILGNHGKFW